MNKTIISIIIVMIILIGGYFLVTNTNSGSSSTNVSNESPVNVIYQSSPSSDTFPNTTSNPQQSTATSSSTTMPSRIIINIKDFAFSPSSITIKKGTKVTWINSDVAPHTVTSDSGNLLNSPTISTGRSFSFTFDNIGTTTYHCSIHKTMKGEIIVKN